MNQAIKIIGILTFIIICGCNQQKYLTRGLRDSVPHYETQIYARYFHDTTFTFAKMGDKFDPDTIVRQIDLPKNLGGEDVHGVVELFAIVDNNGQITDVEILDMILHTEGTKKHSFRCGVTYARSPCNGKEKRIMGKYLNDYVDYKEFFLKKVKSFQLFQNAPTSNEKHYAYSMMIF